MRLGIDVGGTFTDLLLYDDAAQRTYEIKTPSTPEDQSIGILKGIELITEKAGISADQIDSILHGTTVATNAVLESKGSRVGFLTTAGFEYTLHLAKSWTPGPLFGWIVMDKPTPLATLDDTRAINERINAKGDVLEPLDLEQATEAIVDLCESGIEALTISLMHSYANPAHEQALKEIVSQRYPDLPVSLASEILPEFREYDRAITTVMNAYVRPIMQRYLSKIKSRLDDHKIDARLQVVRSDGGLMSANAAANRPVHTILSGPAGGVVSTSMTAKSTNLNLIAFDMGGTSTDVSVIIDGEPEISRSTEVGLFPAKVPTLEVQSVGAGGGSIAWISELTQSLKVGPQSAGSVPGPACYGRGGKKPTVSDANAVLGYLPPKLLGGSMSLDLDAARESMKEIAEALNLSIEDAAAGILDIANEEMLGALRVITVQRGLDPRDLGILAFGGAGPLHANSMAALLGCYPVVVPANPGVLSAKGFIQSDFKNEFVQTYIRSIADLDKTDLTSRFKALHAQASEWLDQQQVENDDRVIKFSVDMRYEQQGFELTIDSDASLMQSGELDKTIEDFHVMHKRLYGVTLEVPVEMIALRVVAIGYTPEISEQGRTTEGVVSNLTDAIQQTRPTYHNGEWVDTPYYDRDKLADGAIFDGPAIVCQYDSTVVVLPDHWVEVDDEGNLKIWPASKDKPSALQ